ncbi:MAG: lysylphosphatidylglycerol synthase transmembrane domain-containing protein [Planctomycetota bacterium]|nr:lysylphosphatidylglycerol synthase transmembrane domain-containing protein [Planctomycetota bacterium]
MKKKFRKTLILTAKLLVAAALLVLVMRKVHWGDYPGPDGQDRQGFATTITQADPYLLTVATVCFLLPLFILAFRWWYLLRLQKIEISLREVARLTFLGTFFNYVVPGSVSGDLVKAYYAAKHTDRKVAVLVSVFIDRALGLLEFVLLPAVVIAVMYSVGADGTDRLTIPAVIVACVLAVTVATLAMLLSGRLRRFLRLGKIISRLPMQKYITLAGEAVGLYGRRPIVLTKAVGITFVGQTVFIIGIMLSAWSLGMDIAWYKFFVYIPIIYIIASVPISPGGLGLVEFFYLTFFAVAAVSESEVLALALTARLIPMLCSLPGLVVALTGPKLPPAEQIRAELTD